MQDLFTSYKMIGMKKPDRAFILHTLTLPRAFSSGQTGGPALLEGRGSPASQQFIDRTSWMWWGRPRMPRSPGLS